MARMAMVTAWLLLVATTAAAGASAATDRQTRIFPLPPERTLAIDLTIGTVRIEGADRSDVELVIERHAPTEEALARIPVSIAETPRNILVKGLQADGATNPAMMVTLVARVPRQATIDEVHIVEGGLTIVQFEGHLTAAVRRGTVDGSNVSGSLRLETEIGNIVLSNARLTRDGVLRLRTFNGDVRLSLSARPSDARILALALNGTIKSEIPLTSRDTWGPRWGEATIGKGEPVISLDVVTGTIEIKSPR